MDQQTSVKMNGMKRMKFEIGLACLCGLLAGCAGQEQTFSSTESEQNGPATSAAVETATSEESAERQEFQVRGVVKEIEPAESRIVINHEEIPNYMPAMTMPFHVQDTNELAGIS